MENKNNEPKHQHRIPTEIEYVEKGRWKVDENIITVVGGLPNEPKQPVASIKLIGYDDNKKPILAVIDLDGNEITERSSNLYQLKRYCLDNEQRLTKEMLIRKNPEQVKEQPVEQPEVKKEIPEIQKESSEVKKGKDLKSIRKGTEEKQKENEQNLTR